MMSGWVRLVGVPQRIHNIWTGLFRGPNIPGPSTFGWEGGGVSGHWVGDPYHVGGQLEDKLPMSGGIETFILQFK